MNAGCPREAVWQCSVSPIFKPGRVSRLLSVTTCLSLHLQVWTVWNGYEKSSLCRRGQTLLCKLAYLKRIAPPLVIFDQFSDVCLRGLRWKFMFSPRSPLLIRSAGNSRSGHRWRSGFFYRKSATQSREWWSVHLLNFIEYVDKWFILCLLSIFFPKMTDASSPLQRDECQVVSRSTSRSACYK